jgi:hypothetical protein
MRVASGVRRCVHRCVHRCVQRCVHRCVLAAWCIAAVGTCAVVLVVVIAGVGACASTGGTHAPGSARGGKVALVVNAPLEGAQRRALVRALPFEVIDLERERAVLFAPDLAAQLDEDAPTTWPAAARAAWTEGAAGCRARSVRPPWGENELAVECAAELARAVIAALAVGQGARTLIVVDGTAQQPHWRARAFAPDADVEWQDADRPDRLGALLERVWRGDAPMTARVVDRVPSPPSPDDAWLRAARAQAFDPPGVAGCVRPMPSSIDVGPDVPMAELAELMWMRISPTVRTGPPALCTVQAFTQRLTSSRVVATLDCEGLPLAIARTVAPTTEDGDVPTSGATNLGVDLASTLIFNACNMQMHLH